MIELSARVGEICGYPLAYRPSLPAILYTIDCLAENMALPELLSPPPGAVPLDAPRSPLLEHSAHPNV